MTTSTTKRPYTVEEIHSAQRILPDPFTGQWLIAGDPDNPVPSYRGTEPLTVTTDEIDIVTSKILHLSWGCSTIRRMRDALHPGGSCWGRNPFVVKAVTPPVSTSASTYDPDLDAVDDAGETASATGGAGRDVTLRAVIDPDPNCEDCAQLVLDIVRGTTQEEKPFKGVLAVMAREARKLGPRPLIAPQIRARVKNVAEDYTRAKASQDGGLSRPKESVAELSKRIGLDEQHEAVLVDILFGIRFNKPLEDDIPMDYVIDRETQRHHTGPREARVLVLGVVRTVKKKLSGLKGRDRTWWERNVTRPADASRVATALSLNAALSDGPDSDSFEELLEDQVDIAEKMETEVMNLLGTGIRDLFTTRYLTVGGGRTEVLWDAITDYFTDHLGQSPLGLGGERIDLDTLQRARAKAELVKEVRDIARIWERELYSDLRYRLLTEILDFLGVTPGPGHRTDTLKGLLEALPRSLYAPVEDLLRTDMHRPDAEARFLRGVRSELRTEIEHWLHDTLKDRASRKAPTGV